jgi:hypothetical protein
LSKHVLDNIVWNALSGPQAKFSAGDGEARRYALGFSPIVGFANQTEPNFAALAAFCQPTKRSRPCRSEPSTQRKRSNSPS